MTTSDTLKADMKNRTFGYILAVVLVGILVADIGARATPKALTPEDAGKLFCKYAYGREATFKKLLTADLQAQWDAGVAASDAWAKAHPGEKPPLGDGVPLQAFPDRAPVCETGKTAERKGVTTLEIMHKFPADAESDWTDRLVLKKADNVWLIDDIQFPPDGRQGLRTALKAAQTEK